MAKLVDVTREIITTEHLVQSCYSDHWDWISPSMYSKMTAQWQVMVSLSGNRFSSGTNNCKISYRLMDTLSVFGKSLYKK